MFFIIKPAWDLVQVIPESELACHFFSRNDFSYSCFPSHVRESDIDQSVTAIIWSLCFQAHFLSLLYRLCHILQWLSRPLTALAHLRQYDVCHACWDTFIV